MKVWSISGLRDLVAEFDGADAAREHEFDFTAADFFVQLHGGEQFCRWGAVSFTWVGKPARSNRLRMRVTSLPGRPSSCAESRAAAIWPMEIASPCRYLP